MFGDESEHSEHLSILQQIEVPQRVQIITEIDSPAKLIIKRLPAK